MKQSAHVYTHATSLTYIYFAISCVVIIFSAFFLKPSQALFFAHMFADDTKGIVKRELDFAFSSPQDSEVEGGVRIQSVDHMVVFLFEFSKNTVDHPLWLYIHKGDCANIGSLTYILPPLIARATSGWYALYEKDFASFFAESPFALTVKIPKSEVVISCADIRKK
jgi:hypothetical protein